MPSPGGLRQSGASPSARQMAAHAPPHVANPESATGSAAPTLNLAIAATCLPSAATIPAQVAQPTQGQGTAVAARHANPVDGSPLASPRGSGGAPCAPDQAGGSGAAQPLPENGAAPPAATAAKPAPAEAGPALAKAAETPPAAAGRGAAGGGTSSGGTSSPAQPAQPGGVYADAAARPGGPASGARPAPGDSARGIATSAAAATGTTTTAPNGRRLPAATEHHPTPAYSWSGTSASSPAASAVQASAAPGTTSAANAAPAETARTTGTANSLPVPATPTALAATILALSRSGHPSAVLRLDPPELGSLSVHVTLAGESSVNLVFVTSTPQATQLLSSTMSDLGQAMTNVGMTLGHTHVGGDQAGGSTAGSGGRGEDHAGAQGSLPSHTRLSQSVTPGSDGTLGPNDRRGARAIA